MDVLGEEVQLQVATDFRARATIADPVQNDFLGGIERGHHPTVLLCQFKASCFDIQLTNRLEQRGLELEVAAQLAKQPGQALLHGLVGEQGLPENREQAVPGSAGHQQQGFVPEVGDFAAALVDTDHGVHRENQRRRGDRAVAFAQCAEHGQAEGRQCHGADKHNGVREQHLYRQRGDGKADQGNGQGIESALPAVIGFCQGAGNNTEEQRDQQAHFVPVPTQRHASGQGDRYPDAVAEFIQSPEATQ